MKFSLVFDNTGDAIPFEVVENYDLFAFVVDKFNTNNQNCFSNNEKLGRDVNKLLTSLHWAVSSTNEVLYDLIGTKLKQCVNLEDYLNQDFLNRLHCDWVFSQEKTVKVHQLRFSSDPRVARLGNILHDQYPDDIQTVRLAEAMQKLGYIFAYEEVNMCIHRLETAFNMSSIAFDADAKWEVFDNPYVDTMVTNNNNVNFSFGYTYVGRQIYNKFEYFDLDLACEDHYNYETLEYSFNLNFKNPETIPFSKEFLAWCNAKGVKPVAKQIPIANIVDLSSNMFEYRKILYRNSRDNNRARIILQ